MNQIKFYMVCILLNGVNLNSALAMGDDDRNMGMNPGAANTLNGPRNQLPMNQNPLFMGHSNVLETANIIANPQTNPMFLGSTLAFSGNDIVRTDIVLNRDVDIDTRLFNGTLSGTISGTGSLTKIGLGNLTVSGDSSAQAWNTTISGGTLQISDGNDRLPTTGNILLIGTATLYLNNINQTIGSLTGTAGTLITLGSGKLTTSTAASTTYAGDITGAGSLTKDGTGILTLSGMNTYWGPTIILEGGLDITGSITSNVSVNNGASLTGTGTITGDVTVDGLIGATTVNDVLIINGNLSLGATGDVECTVSSNGNASLLNVNGTVNLNNRLLLVEVLDDEQYPQEMEYVVIDTGVPGGLGGSNLSGVVEYRSDSRYILTHRKDALDQRVILKVSKPKKVSKPISDN